ncbi:MAG: glycoside hydrolase family 3 N-terminal domain-containing protein [Lachnospirales bacterium]
MDIELKKKIGQMFLCGFNDTKINGHIKNLIENYYLGNVILFSRNLKTENQVVELNADLKRAIENSTSYPPFIAIDEEGGSVSRLRNVYGEFLGHYSIGALGDEKVAYNLGNSIGFKLRNLGINMNLAPVADINSNPENIGIGIRSFGSNKNLVKNMVIEMYKGYENNLLPTLKHFPGLGDVAVDSHHDLPILKKTLEEIEDQELVPFIYGIENGVKSIMVSHIIFDAIDEKYPASMSNAVITGLLKDKLGYNGIIMTDCFEMGAIQKNYGTKEAVIIALNAGIDIFDISHTEELQVEAIEGVYEAVEKGIIPIERINESYEKIVKFKKIFGNKMQDAPSFSLKDEYIKVLNTNGVRNWERKNIKIGNTIALAVNQFSSNPAEDVINNPINISDIFPKKTNIETVGFNKDLNQEDIAYLINRARDKENVLLFVGDMDIYKNQHELYKSLEGKNIYLFDMRLKVDKLQFEPKLYFSAYSYTNETVEVLCDYLKELLQKGI